MSHRVNEQRVTVLWTGELDSLDSKSILLVYGRQSKFCQTFSKLVSRDCGTVWAVPAGQSSHNSTCRFRPACRIVSRPRPSLRCTGGINWRRTYHSPCTYILHLLLTASIFKASIYLVLQNLNSKLFINYFLFTKKLLFSFNIQLLK